MLLSGLRNKEPRAKVVFTPSTLRNSTVTYILFPAMEQTSEDSAKLP